MSGDPATLAVDLGGTHLRTALFRGGRLGPVSTAAHGACRERPLAVDELARLLVEAIGDAKVVGAGLSIAGTVDPWTGSVVVADNLGWEGVPLADCLCEALGLPVRVETDTFCGAATEARLGGAERGTTLYVAIGTGIGHAWIFDGDVWRGARAAATMFGHLVVEPGGRPCYCGARGCLCQYAAGPAIDGLGGSTARGSRVTECDSSMERPSGNADPATAAALERANDALALAIAHALTLVNPDEVVLGGGAAMGAWPDLVDVSRRIETLVHPQVRPIRLRRSALGDAANLLGAALIASSDEGPERRPATRKEGA